MAPISWKSGSNGNWNAASDWSSGTVPGAGDDVTIGASGTYTVTISDTEAAHSLTIDDAGATVNDTGTLTITSTLTVSAGTFELSSGGTISGGTLSASGGTFAFDGGTLNGVVYDGTMDLSPSNSSVVIANGLTVTGVNGSGPGTINLTGYDDYLYLEGTQTLDNATINLGSSAGYNDFLYQYDNTGTGNETLTLGPNLTINADSTNYVYIYGSGGTGDGIVNEGTINAAGTGELYEQALNFTNDGTITVSNGDRFYAYDNFINNIAGKITGFGTVAGALTNNGLIDAMGGDLDVTAAITGSGRLQIESGSELELGVATGEAATFAATTGKLRIDYPSSANYSGTIEALAGSDILELASTNATGVTPGAFNGTTTTLTVNLNGGGTLTYSLAGNYSGDVFTLTHVNNNSDIALNAVTTGTPTITAPASTTVGIGQAGAISGISVAESPTISGESFTVTLADIDGLLSANTNASGGGGTISPSNGGKTLTIQGTLAQVNADLTTLSDTEATTASDTIAINAGDSNGGIATQETIAVTVNALPAITAPTAATVVQNQATAITGVSLTESGNTSSESFTVTLADTSGDLAASGTGVSGSGTTSLTVVGSLSQVNSDLATLTDTEASTAADTITLNASDSFGNSAASQSIAVTVTPQSGPPAITAPTVATIGVGQAGAISGVSLAESNTTVGETFTVTLADAKGLLSATGTGVSGSGTTSLSIAGSLAQVNSDLATLTDRDGMTPSDTITLNASDSNGGRATPTTIAVTVNGLPAITVPTTATVTQGQAAAISGVSLTESGDTSGESFTVTFADTSGDLSATGAGVYRTRATSLTITGSLSQVNSDLATLTDTDASAATDTITLNVGDSFGNSAQQQTIAVAVTSVPVITAPASVTIGVGQTNAISGVSLSASGSISGETFTVTLADANGDLSATGIGVSGSGTTSLSIAGSLAQVDSDLATLTDKDGTTPPDTITIDASDSNGRTAIAEMIAVTVNGLPAIAAPTAATVVQNQATAITGISLTESGNTSGESFTVTLVDANGDLAASGTGVSGSGTTGLTVMGSLSQVNSDLATLTDTDASAATDTITLNVGDSFGNSVTESVPINVGVDQPPMLSNGGYTASYLAGGAAIAVDPYLSAYDPDSQDLQGASVAITSGFLSGDTLTANTSGTSIATTYDATSGVLTLSGSDSVADYQSVLDTVAFSSSNSDPTVSGSDTSRTITFVANDGTQSSSPLTTTVTVSNPVEAIEVSDVVAPATLNQFDFASVAYHLDLEGLAGLTGQVEVQA